MANEKRLIDAEALIAEICKDCGNGCDLVDDYCILVGEIMKAPTVDAVEVVRCKDCYWWNKERIGINGECVCNWFSLDKIYSNLTSENDFCSYGERKDNG